MEGGTAVSTHRHRHTYETRAQLAAWDAAVGAWRAAGMHKRDSRGNTHSYGSVGDVGKVALDAACAWLMKSPGDVVGTPLSTAYGEAR